MRNWAARVISVSKRNPPVNPAGESAFMIFAGVIKGVHVILHTNTPLIIQVLCV